MMMMMMMMIMTMAEMMFTVFFLYAQVRCMMLEIEEEYREAVLAHLAMMGQTLPSDVDPLDVAIPSMDSSSDIGVWVGGRVAAVT